MNAIKDFLYRRPRSIVGMIRRREFWNAKSYYPDKRQHTSWENIFYQIGQILKYGAANEYYFMYGLDVKPKSERSLYVNYAQFHRRRDYLNYSNNIHNSTCVLRNKLYFDIFAKAIGVKTPTIEAYYSNNQLHSIGDGFRIISFAELAAMGNRVLFCKETEGECGAGIFKLTIKDGKFFIKGKEVSANEIENRIHDSEYLFQNLVVQHPLMSELYAGSINTMRMVTVRSLKDGALHLMPSILRIGANGSFVDNTSQGGIAVGFDLETGRLNQYGFYKPQFGLRTEVHPNSGIRLNDFCIPFIKEAEEKALFFHSMLRGIHSIGWDIAISPDGPIFIEGNDNWEINGPQVGNHGLKNEFLEYFYK